MTRIRTGGCQCGAVRFRAVALQSNAHVCHCRMCQKASGNLFAAFVGVDNADFAWTRGTPSEFMSSEKVHRGFCADCGTPLFFQHDGSSHISIAIGALDDPGRVPLDFQLGAERRLPQVAQLLDVEDHGTIESANPEAATAIRISSRQHPDNDTDD